MGGPAPDAGRLEALAPGLLGRRLTIGDWPTPLTPVDIGARQQLWVKDEGEAAERYGGNKVRKLEWLLPTVRDDVAVVTAGAVGSNHVIATATHAAPLGIGVHAVLTPQPDTTHARRNAAAIAHLTRSTWPAGGEVSAVAASARALAHAWREGGARPSVIWVGGSSPHGTLGWADGALEILDQCDEAGIGPPRRVYVPAGSGGIAAGLLLGFALADVATRVHAVRVADRMWANPTTTLILAKRAARLARRAGAPQRAIAGAHLVYEHGWIGSGYGTPTAAGEAATSIAARHEITVDPTYSAKALAAALAAVRDPDVTGPVVWVNTVNRRPLEGLLDGSVPDPPRRLAGLLEPVARP
jgi:D-cysteine desulfhydrase